MDSLSVLGLGLVQRRSCAGGFGLSLDPPQQRFATFLDETMTYSSAVFDDVSAPARWAAPG